jgi:hypothetical protein
MHICVACLSDFHDLDGTPLAACLFNAGQREQLICTARYVVYNLRGDGPVSHVLWRGLHVATNLCQHAFE